MEPELNVLDVGRVWFDGLTTQPRLDHPEGIALHADGSVWCGGEAGQIYRLGAEADSIELVACTGGFCLGLAFSPDAETLYACDLLHARLYSVEVATGALTVFAGSSNDHPLQIPNAIAIDRNGVLYVTDSHGAKEPGPGILRFTPDGHGIMWNAGPLDFANGITLAPDGQHLYVAETWGRSVTRFPINADGSSGAREIVARTPGMLPDGLAFGPDHALYVACYEPSAILRIDVETLEIACVVCDIEAHLLCHPTNLVFRGETLLAANLGRWHITALELGGLSLKAVKPT